MWVWEKIRIVLWISQGEDWWDWKCLRRRKLGKNWFESARGEELKSAITLSFWEEYRYASRGYFR